eukprot:6480327-Amphidinium_carterae.1
MKVVQDLCLGMHDGVAYGIQVNFLSCRLLDLTWKSSARMTGRRAVHCKKAVDESEGPKMVALSGGKIGGGDSRSRAEAA